MISKMKFREKLLLFLHGKKICTQCNRVLYLYHFENKSSICRRCEGRNRNRYRKEMKQYIYVCPYCRSKRYHIWRDSEDTWITCLRCNKTFENGELVKVLKKRYRKKRKQKRRI